MRARFIREGHRERVMIRTNSTTALCKVAATIKAAGFTEVGLLRFGIHLIFPKRMTNKQKTETIE